MTTHHTTPPDGAPEGGRPTPPRNTGVQGPTPPSYATLGKSVFFDCPTCKHENQIKKNVIVSACERCGGEIDRRATLPQANNGLKIDWIRATFQDSKILEDLADLKPLEPADIKWIQREEHTREALQKDLSMSWEEKADIHRTLCPYFQSGLKSTKGGTPFWDNTWEWFRGAKVAKGSQGKKGNEEGNKTENCMVTIPGKALDHLRKITGKTDFQIIEFFHGYGATFTRLDLAVDHLPQEEGPGIINPTAEALEMGFFTSTWDKEKTPPKFITALDYSQQKGEEGVRPAEAIIETITLGSRKSETYGRIYDKRREMVANGYQDPEIRWERFEIEVKKKRAKALGDEIIKWGPENWKKESLGLFRRFLGIRDENHHRARMKERNLAPWYSEVLNQAEETTLSTPRQVKKDREEHKALTIEQSGKRIFKVLLADLKEGGPGKIGDFIESLIFQGFKGMMAEDWEQLYDHLKTQAGDFEESQLIRDLCDFTESLKQFKRAS